MEIVKDGRRRIRVVKIFVFGTPFDGVVIQVAATVNSVNAGQRQRGEHRTGALKAISATASCNLVVVFRLKPLKGRRYSTVNAFFQLATAAADQAV